MIGNRIERLHVIGAAVLALLIVAIGWLFLISPQRSETADIQGQVSDAQLQNTTLQTRITQLGGEQKNRATYAGALAAAREALPADTDMSSFLRGMQATGAATGTSVTSVSVGNAAPLTAPAAQAPAPGAAASSGAPAPGAPAAATTSGIFQIPITANVAGTPAALNAFLTRLQTTQPRAVLISEVTMGGAGRTATLQLKITAFVAPTAAAAAPAAPTPASSGD